MKSLLKHFLQIQILYRYDLKAYDDLDACAACCMGVAVFSRPFNDLAQENLNYIDLTGVSIPIDDQDEVNGVKYQNCFNQTLLKYKKEHDNKLNSQALSDFVDEFNKACFKKTN